MFAHNDCRLIECEHEWDSLESEWGSLFRSSPSASAPLHFDWLRQWWAIYGTANSNHRTLRILAIRREGRLVGVLPLQLVADTASGITRHRLIFLSTGEAQRDETCPDYLNLLHAPCEDAYCIGVAAAALCRSRWEQIHLQSLPTLTPLRALCGEDTRLRNGCLTHAGTCHIADLSGGFEAYLSRLSAKSRQHARQDMRSANAAGARLVIADNVALALELFQELVQLHQERWTAAGRSGCFASPLFTEFHRRLISMWAAAQQAVVSVLYIGEMPVAAVYGFIVRGKFDFYQLGAIREAVGPIKSPGTTALLLLMSALSERNIRAFDFLKGSSVYKRKLATTSQDLCDLTITRWNARSTVYFANRAMWRLVGKAKRIVLKGRQQSTLVP